MTAKDLMTPNPACCTMQTPVQEVARMMVEHDCGEIPLVEQPGLKRVVGVVTDRDIVCRAVAEGKNPLTLTAAAVMTSPAVTVNERDDLDEVIRVMESHQIRRVPVLNQNAEVCGILSLADIARRNSRKDTGDLVREVSAPSR
jgi:CBS domain-containing protein